MSDDDQAGPASGSRREPPTAPAAEGPDPAEETGVVQDGGGFRGGPGDGHRHGPQGSDDGSTDDGDGTT